LTKLGIETLRSCTREKGRAEACRRQLLGDGGGGKGPMHGQVVGSGEGLLRG